MKPVVNIDAECSSALEDAIAFLRSLDFPEHIELTSEFVAVRTERLTANGTADIRIVFEPSQRLLDLVAAVRARNGDRD